jgi:hypothetical protein
MELVVAPLPKEINYAPPFPLKEKKNEPLQ